MPIAVRGAPEFITDQGIARAATSTAELQAADIIDEAWIPGDATLKAATELMLRRRTSRVLVHGRHEPIGVLPRSTSSTSSPSATTVSAPRETERP